LFDVDVPFLETLPRFFSFPVGELGMGLIEMPHSFQRMNILMKIVFIRSFISKKIEKQKKYFN